VVAGHAEEERQMDIWDMVQHQQIQRVEREVRDVRSDAQRSARQTVENVAHPLERRLDRLSLVCRALWTLLKDTTNLSEEDLNRRVTELDMQDGHLDGKITKPPVKCPKCQSAICKKFSRCLFCGEQYTGGNAFDAV